MGRRKKGFFSFLIPNSGRGRSHDAFPVRMRWDVSPETKRGIFTIALFVLAALSFLGLFDLAGNFGFWVDKILGWCFGDLKWIFPLVVLVFGYFLLKMEEYEIKTVNYFGVVLLLIGLTSLWHLQFNANEANEMARAGLGGGYIGAGVSVPLVKLMGLWGSLVVSVALFLVGTLLAFETSIYGLMWPVKFFQFFWNKIKGANSALAGLKRPAAVSNDDYEEDEEPAEDEVADEAVEEEESTEAVPQFVRSQVATDHSAEEDDFVAPKKFGKKIELPLELLTSKSGKPTSGDIKNNQEIIRKTLANFGIVVEMADVNIGPTVTQYTFRPADGVRLSKIVNLNSDLALALAAHPIRIEAPIPGKSLVGVEIPNQMAAKVTMRDLLVSKEFKDRGGNLSIALGKDVSGRPIFARLDKMPHLLIAGATGSGKSVCINSVIVSLLYQNSPDDLKFILVDPKRVELPLYNSIPYLLTPVITDVKKTINALKWTVLEMERRFELLSKKGKRNIESYNQTATDRLPYIVFIIDELADLMTTAANDIEGGIVRLAQMARAVGIHLILATQRPSVEVITGLIKANIPGRIAFSVASLIDSRTILDTSGAEKLVGRGDMLYLGPEVAKPKRIQGVYLADKEIQNVIDYIKDQGEATYIEGIVEKQGGGSFGGGSFDDDGDALLGEAKDVIRESGKASASLLQRRLKVGYARAARILDLLEERGIIGPADGAKPREVFLDRLGEVDPLTFAAREHDLEGELTPTVFNDEPSKENGEDAEDEYDEDVDREDVIEEADETSTEFEEELAAEDETMAEVVAETEEDNAEEENGDDEEDASSTDVEDNEIDESPRKKTFQEDEWT